MSGSVSKISLSYRTTACAFLDSVILGSTRWGNEGNSLRTVVGATLQRLGTYCGNLNSISFSLHTEADDRNWPAPEVPVDGKSPLLGRPESFAHFEVFGFWTDTVEKDFGGPLDIDSGEHLKEQHRFKSPQLGFIVSNLIPQLQFGDFFNSIDPTGHQKLCVVYQNCNFIKPRLSAGLSFLMFASLMTRPSADIAPDKSNRTTPLHVPSRAPQEPSGPTRSPVYRTRNRGVFFPHNISARRAQTRSATLPRRET
jgi:hypothetical protein